MRGGCKEVNEVLRYAAANGFVVARSKKHIVLKRGKMMVSMSSSPSDPYAMKNAMKDIRRVIELDGGN